jgi:hypothetical protein
VVIDEAHTFFHERKGTSPEVKAHNAVVAELSRLVEELVRKGRNVAIGVMLLTQRPPGQLPGRDQLRHPHPGRCRGRLGRVEPVITGFS